MVTLLGACRPGASDVAARPAQEQLPAATSTDEAPATQAPSPARTFAPSNEPPPELNLVGEDYEKVVRSYEAFRTWVFRHPDPELLEQIYHPECSCYIEKRLLEHYQQQGLWWTGGPEGIAVRDVQVVDNRLPTLVHLLVVLERPSGGELIDSTGRVHDRVEPRGRWAEDLIFVRDDEASPWKLREFNDRGPVP